MEPLEIYTGGPHVVVGGERWWLFSVDYQHEGKTFCFELHARSFEEAAAMLRSIRTTAIEVNQIAGQIPAVPGAGLYVRAIVWWRNFWDGLKGL